MADQKVATEVAEAEFARWAEGADLNFDPKGWDAEDKKSFTDSKNKLVRAIELGHLVVDDKGRFVYTPQASDERDPIVFSEPDGGALMSMDQKKKGHDMAKMFALIASITGETEVRFAKMKSRDLKVCQAITALFLG